MSEISNSCNAHKQTGRRATTTTSERKRNSCIAQLRRDLCRSLHHTAGVVARQHHASPCQTQKPLKLKTQNQKNQKKKKKQESCAAAAATTMRRKTCFFDSNKYLPLHSRLLLLLLLFLVVIVVVFYLFFCFFCFFFFLCKLQK